MANAANDLQIEDIPALCEPHCKIKDRQKVEKILNSLVGAGVQKLQVVSDFDYTITKQRQESGKPVLSSFGIFNACKSLPKKFIEESDKLHQKYRPIEIDPNVPLEEKVQSMIEWWTKSGKLLVGFSLDQSEIDEVAGNYKNSLRDGTHDFFQDLNKLQVPVLVFSAGLGDCVVSVLRQANVLFPNVKVISNFLQYKDGLLNGFQDRMIHTFNKNETALKGTEYYDQVHDRDHVILLGDSIGDSGMANGVPVSSHVLKIGFLFDHPEENLEKYLEAFDIVLIDDQTMNVPRAIFALIAQSKA